MENAKVASSTAQPAEKPARKGKVYYIKTDRALVPWQRLREYEIAKSTDEQRTASKQLTDAQTYVTEKGLVPHPFDVGMFLAMMENCSYFDACVRQIARDVTGQGWDLSLAEGYDKEDDTERDKVWQLLDDPNTTEQSLADVLERLVIDWGCIGWWCLEVARDPQGQVNGLYHVPANTMLVHKDGNKYCQRRNQKFVWFKRFGYGKEVDVETGVETESLPPERRASELLFYANYYPKSSWYGVPPILSGAGSVMALIGIRDYNLAFFENYGVPAAIVTVEGDWDEDAVKQLSDFIDVEIKRSANAHKTVVLNPPEGGSVKWEPLVVEVKEGHFKLYAKQLRDDVLVCYKMPPYRIGIAEQGSLGGTTASEATRIYIDSVVNPLKAVLERLFTRKIIKEGLDVERYEFDLGEVDLRDLQAITTRCQQLFGMGVMNRNEIREELGLELLQDDDDAYANTYFISQGYQPLGEESALQLMDKTDGALLELRQRIDQALAAERNRPPVPAAERQSGEEE